MGGRRVPWHELGRRPPPSARQCEILHLASHGWRDRNIAAALGVSVYTVRSHWSTIYARLGLHHRHTSHSMRARAVALAIRKGYIS